MSRRLRPSLLVVLFVLVPVLLSACGSSHSRITTGTYAGENGAGAPYLNVGPLVYEVQQSRQLNPADAEDANYLTGLTPAQRALAPGEEWFAVFLQVFNNHDTPYPAATELVLSGCPHSAKNWPSVKALALSVSMCTTPEPSCVCIS